MSDESQIDPQTAPPTGNVNANSKQALVNTFQGNPLESKKWLAMMVGLACVMVIEIGGMTLVALSDPSKSMAYVSLANLGIMFIGAMVGSLVTGQSFVEWKTSSTLGDMHNAEVKAAVDTQNINVKKDVHMDIPYTKDMDEKIKEDRDEDAPEVKPFSGDAK